MTQSGEIHIANSSHRGEKEYIAAQIDSFIRNSNQTSLNVKQEGQLVDLFLGLSFWLGGIFCLLWQGDQIEVLTCSWDKTLNRIVLQQRNFLSLSTGKLEWSIDDIESATIESTVHSTLNRSFQTVTYKKYYLVLVLKSGERLRLTFYETVLLKNKEKVVKYISSLLAKTNHAGNSTKVVERLAKQSTIEQEIATWQEATRVSPDNAEAHYHLGLALYRHDQRQDATDSLERAKDLFKVQGNSKKADEIQSVLWELGLE
ncbi:MAG TPA: tetratricopeptide repeat protein [Cyanophyceae cyanobacterium]